MTIDERARRAATDLLTRADQRPIPTLDELTVERRRPNGRILAAVAAAVLAIIGVTVFVTGDDRDVAPAMPGGGESRTWAPPETGLSIDIPASWPERGPSSGFAYAVGHEAGDGAIVADRLHLLAPADAATVGADRAADLQALGATDIETSITEIDGRPAALQRYRLHLQATRATKDLSNEYVVTEYDVPDGEWVLIFGVSERVPADRSELIDWILSTVEVDDVPAAETSLDEPDGPLPPPPGTDAKQWALPELGVTIDVPFEWAEQAPVGARFRQMFPPGGGPQVAVVRISAGEAATREEDIEYENGVIDATDEIVVDGRRARVLRYRKTPRGYPLRVTVHTEYLIDTGDGDVLMVWTAENAGGEPYAELLRWIRSTIDLT